VSNNPEDELRNWLRLKLVIMLVEVDHMMIYAKQDKRVRIIKFGVEENIELI
jgi:hypothetical protein